MSFSSGLSGLSRLGEIVGRQLLSLSCQDGHPFPSSAYCDNLRFKPANRLEHRVALIPHNSRRDAEPFRGKCRPDSPRRLHENLAVKIGGDDIKSFVRFVLQYILPEKSDETYAIQHCIFPGNANGGWIGIKPDDAAGLQFCSSDRQNARSHTDVEKPPGPVVRGQIAQQP